MKKIELAIEILESANASCKRYNAAESLNICHDRADSITSIERRFTVARELILAAAKELRDSE